MIRMCCVCQRVEQGQEWRSADTLSSDTEVTHGYCPQCFAGAMAELEQVAGRRRLPVVSPGNGAGLSGNRGPWQPCV
jgi:hypothetical protein